MKIGILTLPLHTNYGGILQAYALQSVLRGMGHDVKIIDGGIHAIPMWKIILGYLKQLALSLGKTRLHHIHSFQIRRFVKDYLEILCPNKVFSENTFDVIIVGSDQVWRNSYAERIEYYFLDFAKEWDVKRVAYAASFGIDSWDYPDDKTELCKKLVHLFDYISVREESGIHLCKEFLDAEASMMIDPTLLLSAQEYNEIGKKNNSKIQGELLAYILDSTEEKQKTLKCLKETYQIESYSLNSQSALFNQYLSVEYWLDGFSKAKFVFTDSFHGCVFSLIFNVPFIVYANKERGMARFYSLLKLFGLENRLIYNMEDLSRAVHSPIDWKYVNECLGKYQSLAIKTIEECLKN